MTAKNVWMGFIVLGLTASGWTDIKFEDVKTSSRSDPFGKGEYISLRFLVNNVNATGNAAFGPMVGLNPSVGAFFTRDGKELAFSVCGEMGLTTGIEKNITPRSGVGESRGYAAALGLDLNYIVFNQPQFFLSMGLAEISHLGGIMVEQTNTRFAMVPFINLLGLNCRSRFYPLSELFLTGQIGVGFLSIYSRELQAYSTGTPATDPGLTSADADSPTAFLFEFSGEYRPSAAFAFTCGIRYRAIGYKASDPSAGNAVISKSLSYFAPFIGVTLLH